MRQNLVRRLGLDERKVAQLFSSVATVVISQRPHARGRRRSQAELARLGAIARIKNISPDEKAKFKITTRTQRSGAEAPCSLRAPRMSRVAAICNSRPNTARALRRRHRERSDEDTSARKMLLIEKRIRGLKVGQKPGAAASAAPAILTPSATAGTGLRRADQRRIDAAAAVAARAARPVPSAPRGASMRPRAEPRKAPVPSQATPSSPSTNPFGGRTSWRSVLRLRVAKTERPAAENTAPQLSRCRAAMPSLNEAPRTSTPQRSAPIGVIRIPAFGGLTVRSRRSRAAVAAGRARPTSATPRGLPAHAAPRAPGTVQRIRGYRLLRASIEQRR